MHQLAFGVVALLVASISGQATAQSSMSPTTPAENIVLCDRKLNYQPAAESSPLIGIWVGELFGYNVPYGSDYIRCLALAVERVTAEGNVTAKLVLGETVKDPRSGANFGAKGYVFSWIGTVRDGGKVLRFVSEDGKSVYEFKIAAANRLEGRVTFDNGDGRLFLSKR